MLQENLSTNKFFLFDHSYAIVLVYSTFLKSFINLFAIERKNIVVVIYFGLVR